MIPVLFESPHAAIIQWLPTVLELPWLAEASLTRADLQVRRVTPNERPRLFVLFVQQPGGRRINEVHKLARFGVQCWATFADGTLDYDSREKLTAEVMFHLEQARIAAPQISAVTDSNGSYPVVDPSGVEFNYSTIEYQLRGAAVQSN